MIKLGDQVITSRGRYGSVIQIECVNQRTRCLVKIGTKSHWIYEDQLILPTHSIRLKTVYTIDYCGRIIEDSIEVCLKKDSILYENGTSNLENLCKEFIEKQVGIKPNIKTIKIS